MNFKMEKYDGLGNDYFVYDTSKNDLELNKNRVIQICNRHFGAGADGIVEGTFDQELGAYVKIWNSDGTEAEISGNGVRIFAKYLKDAGYQIGDKVQVKTQSGLVDVEFLDNKARSIKVAMGKVSFWSQDVPVTGSNREMLNEDMVFGRTLHPTSCCFIGNPHCIIPMKEISKPLVVKIGEYSECARYFPNRINTQIMKYIDDENIAIEIFERGSGYTIGSGTGACAAAAVAYRLGEVNSNVKVHMPGGVLEVEIDEEWNVSMTGDIAYIGCMMLGEDFVKGLEQL